MSLGTHLRKKDNPNTTNSTQVNCIFRFHTFMNSTRGQQFCAGWLIQSAFGNKPSVLLAFCTHHIRYISNLSEWLVFHLIRSLCVCIPFQKGVVGFGYILPSIYLFNVRANSLDGRQVIKIESWKSELDDMMHISLISPFSFSIQTLPTCTYILHGCWINKC